MTSKTPARTLHGMTLLDSQTAVLDANVERTQRVSGFQSPASLNSDLATPAASAQPRGVEGPPTGAQAKLVSEANAELDARTAEHLAHPLQVLFAQRDRALVALAEEQAKRRQLEADIQLRAAANAASTQNLLAEAAAAQKLEHEAELSRVRDELVTLQAQIDAAQVEVDETRLEAIKLQEERDDAIRATDDVRLEMSGEMEAALRKTEDMQLQLDHVRRLWEDDQERSATELDAVNERLTEALGQLAEARAALAQSIPAGQVAQLQAQNEELRLRLNAVLASQSLPPSSEAAPPSVLPENPFARS